MTEIPAREPRNHTNITGARESGPSRHGETPLPRSLPDPGQTADRFTRRQPDTSHVSSSHPAFERPGPLALPAVPFVPEVPETPPSTTEATVIQASPSITQPAEVIYKDGTVLPADIAKLPAANEVPDKRPVAQTRDNKKQPVTNRTDVVYEDGAGLPPDIAKLPAANEVTDKPAVTQKGGREDQPVRDRPKLSRRTRNRHASVQQDGEDSPRVAEPPRKRVVYTASVANDVPKTASQPQENSQDKSTEAGYTHKPNTASSSADRRNSGDGTPTTQRVRQSERIPAWAKPKMDKGRVVRIIGRGLAVAGATAAKVIHDSVRPGIKASEVVQVKKGKFRVLVSSKANGKRIYVTVRAASAAEALQKVQKRKVSNYLKLS